MAKTIFENPNRCTIDDCDQFHCCICGVHVLGPCWGKIVCSTCVDVHNEALMNETLTQADIDHWENAFKLKRHELLRSF
jgi:hypothetical protein